MKAMLPILLVLPLGAGDLDLYLALGSLSPGGRGGLPAYDKLGQPIGAAMTLGSEFQQYGVGAAYTLLSYGDWRLRGQLEFMRGTSEPRFSVMYAAPSAPTRYLDMSGTLEHQSLNPALEVSYISSGAGEYGVGIEPHYMVARYATDRLVLDFPGVRGTFPTERRSISFNDVFVSLHATYVLRFGTYGVLSRVSFGRNVSGSAKAITSYSESQFSNVSRDLLRAIRPQQELKFSAGVRF
jgi:hypothetical protein